MPDRSDAPSPGVSAETPASISSPDRLETPFGAMEAGRDRAGVR
jgi:hypothetical protein